MTASEENLEFIVCWENPDQPRLMEEIQAFWRRERAIQSDMIDTERARNVVVAVLNEDGRVVATSGAFRQMNDTLRLWVWEVRVFVLAELRRGSLARKILVCARDYLADRNARKMEPHCSGIFTRIEHEGMRQGGIHARTRSSHFNYIGVDDAGNLMTVYWFDDAQTPLM